jgi:two-component system, OmpR family, sensor histidine kinase SenX3
VIRRLALPFAAVTLGVLLALLAFLQYRWLGQVSDGERQRMRATLEARARDFAAEFDRELGKAAAAFAPPPGSGLATGQNVQPAGSDQPLQPKARRAVPERQDVTSTDLTPEVAQRWDRWLASASDAKLVREVFVVDRSTPDLTLRRFDPATRQLTPAEWPEAFHAARDRWAAEFAKHLPTRVFLDDLSDVPALVVPPQPDIFTVAAGNGVFASRTTIPLSGTPGAASAGTSAPSSTARLMLQQPGSIITVLWLDLDEITRVLLPSLAKRYFASDDVFDYQVTVLLRRDPAKVFFETTGARGSGTEGRAAGPGDASVPMFRLRIAEFFSAPTANVAGGMRASPAEARGATASGGAAQGQTTSQAQGYSVSVMRFEGTRPVQPRVGAVIAVSDASGGWLLRLVHRAGSLDAAVERLRRRNLAISSTILGLLAVSLGFVLVSTRRAQRLAAQQVEFVASVSHELRTPLSVIRSAGENLADGVVESPDQVRRYGALVAEEGRKLGAMVEQVMEYAGMQSDQPRWQVAQVDLHAVVEEAVAAARRLPEARGASIEVEADDGLAPFDGDRAALVRAVQNLVENALKYGKPAAGAGCWVGVRVTAPDGSARQATLSDAAQRRPSTQRGATPSAESKGRKPDAGSRAWISIEVTDRGPGIDAAERKRIFEPFVRGRAASTARVPGNGLGLSIVRRVVEGHGGRVRVTGNPEGGATFRIELPVSSQFS